MTVFQELHEIVQKNKDMTTRKLALLSELAVFKDILPGFSLFLFTFFLCTMQISNSYCDRKGKGSANNNRGEEDSRIRRTFARALSTIYSISDLRGSKEERQESVREEECTIRW